MRAADRGGAGGGLPVAGTLAAAGLFLRRLRAERGFALLLFAVVTATSILFGAAPRLFNRSADDGLGALVSAATPSQRNLSIAEVASAATTIGESVGAVQAEGERLAAAFPPALADLVAQRSLQITSVRFSVTNPPSYETTIALRYQDGLAEATRLVAGRWPASTGAFLPFAEWNTGTTGGGTSTPAPVRFEAALSTAAASEAGVNVGDALSVTLDGSDPMLADKNLRIVPAEIDIVGLFEPLDPAAPFWASGGGSLLRATQVGTEERPSAQLTAIMSADAYPGLAASRLPFHDEWLFAIDPARLDAGSLDELRTDLKRLPFGTGSELSVSDAPVIRTGLTVLLDQYAAQLARAASLLSVAAIGPLALAAAVLGMLAILAGSRRRTAQSLARGRGASGAQVLAAELLEGVLLAGIAAIAGLIVAVAAVPARSSVLSVILAAGIGGGAMLLLAAASWTSWRPRARHDGDAPAAGSGAPSRRLVLELTIALIAAAGVLLVRERGLAVPAGSGSAATGGVTGVNPLLAVIPVLGGLAAGIAAVRLYPLPLRALGWLAARRRDLVPVLGLRSITRHRTAPGIALLVLMLTAAFGAFASVVVTTIDRGQVVATYRDVGADDRIERTDGSALDPSLVAAVAAAPGVEAVAPVIEEASAEFSTAPTQHASISVVAFDPRTFATVTAGTDAEPRWPSDFLAPASSGASSAPGTTANPIPAILSSRVPGNTMALAPGATFQMTVLGHELVFRLVEQRDQVDGIGSGPFALVPLDWVAAATGARSQPPTALWVRASPSASAPLGTAVAAEGSTRLASRYDALARLRSAPLVMAVVVGFELALVVAAVFMALAIVGGVILSAAQRDRDLAYLRTLGVTGRQSLALTLIEQAPPALIALVPGVALGIGIAYLLEPGLGLAAFEGVDGVPLAVDWPALLPLAAALLGVVAAAVLAGTWLSLRTRAADALRMGEH